MTTPEKIEVPGGLTQQELVAAIRDAREEAWKLAQKSEYAEAAKLKARAEYLQSLLPKEPK